MNIPLLVLVFSQFLFATSDLIGRHYMLKYGFNFSLIIAPWFWGYMIIRTFATFGQLYVFTQFELGRTITMFGVVGIILANTTGYLLLGEVLPPIAYIGVTLAVVAFIVLALA